MQTPVLPRRAARRPAPAVDLLLIVVASAVATQVKTITEGVVQPIAERTFPPSELERRMMGADPAGHPENMPPHILVDKIARLLGRDPVSDSTRDLASQAVHWATGIGGGLAYGAAAERLPWLARGRGTLFGAILLAATHGSLLPAVGIQESLRRLPRSWWLWEPGSHLVFGAVLDTALRLERAAVVRRA